eukprot:CAMPEP_0119312548 /NCGR_PEP_ID=MMETSP1333-20130426/26876_1 /TAXON_ID=418940 /ORGANISM="Scyphosphaera apsteinii, Strain RCC1455" /LENGTH=103 /DNA_ID=CAMNT_0007317189 /DNA_START=489 /DNA_END=797 /DNA_ORIENTATION=-
MAKVLPVYQAFCKDNAAWILDMYGYAPKKGKLAGQRGIFYALFRDKALPRALRHIRAEMQGVDVDRIPATTYLYKGTKLSNSRFMVRAIVGWEFSQHCDKEHV